MTDTQDKAEVTYTQYIEVGDASTVLFVPTHILPNNHRRYEGEGSGTNPASSVLAMNQAYGSWAAQRSQPYAWFNDHCNQELLVAIHEIVYSKAVENFLLHSAHSKASSSASTQPYRFQRSGNLRMFFTFRPVEHIQHMLLFPNQTSSNKHGLVRRAAFISEYGRRVLPYLDAATHGGSGYTAFKVLPQALHVYVDNLEVTSPHGIFKVLRLLDPKHSLSLDIPSYFKTAKSLTEEGSSKVLPQVPFAGLNVDKRDTKSSTSLNNAGRRTKQKAKAKPQKQPTIAKVFAKCQEATKQKEMDEYNLSDDILEGIWEFDSSQPTPETKEISDNFATEEDSTVSSTTRDDSDRPGTKRQRSVATIDHSHTSKKGKFYQLSQAREETLSEVEADCDDPFDQLIADQTRKKRIPNTNVRVTKKRWMKLEDTDDDIGEEGDSTKASPEPLLSTCPVSEGGESDVTSCTTMTSLSKLQQHRLSEAAREPISANSSLLCDFTAKDIDISFDISTPDLETSLSDVETSLASHSPPYQNINVPWQQKQSASQPVSHSMRVDRESMTLSIRTKSYSDSVLEVEEFSDITNTVKSPTRSSPKKKLSDPSVRRSIMDLTRDPVAQHQESSSASVVIEKKKRRKPLPTSGTEIFHGAKKVADLNRQQLSDWMRLNQPVLMDIFKRKQYSWRHEEFNTNPKVRAAMKWKYDKRRFTGDQVTLITDILLKIFCWRHMKYFNYVMSVLLPETLVRVIADVHGVDFDEAEKLMFNFEGQASVDLTAE